MPSQCSRERWSRTPDFAVDLGFRKWTTWQNHTLISPIFGASIFRGPVCLQTIRIPIPSTASTALFFHLPHQLHPPPPPAPGKFASGTASSSHRSVAEDGGGGAALAPGAGGGPAEVRAAGPGAAELSLRASGRSGAGELGGGGRRFSNDGEPWPKVC